MKGLDAVGLVDAFEGHHGHQDLRGGDFAGVAGEERLEVIVFVCDDERVARRCRGGV